MRRIGIVLTLSLLASCKGETKKIPVPAEVRLDLYEARILGAGLAPDSVRVHLVEAGQSFSKDSPTVFEGQDVGALCYTWRSPRDLWISMSGGYVDHVARQVIVGRQSINVKYTTEISCSWKPSAPA
jgi:hypothetical protein